MTDRNEVIRLIQKGRRAETRGKAVGGCLTSVLTALLINLAHGFTFMIMVGILHAEWSASIPTIGYWWSVLTVALLRGVFSPFAPSRKDKP